MNTERIFQVADAIERAIYGNKLGFNMHATVEKSYPDHSGRGCGTVACIAGWARVIMENGRIAPGGYGGVLDPAQHWLGLTASQAHRLFAPTNVSGDPYNATDKQAVWLLRNFALNGNIDWKTALSM